MNLTLIVEIRFIVFVGSIVREVVLVTQKDRKTAGFRHNRWEQSMKKIIRALCFRNLLDTKYHNMMDKIKEHNKSIIKDWQKRSLEEYYPQ